MKKLILALALAASFSAQADSIYAGGWSVHMSGSTDNTGYEYNDNHELLALEYKNIFAATMVNSYHTRSYALGYKYSVIEAEYFNVDAVAGAFYGYTEQQNDFLRVGNVNGFGSIMIEANTPYVKPVVMLFGTAFVLSFKYEF